MHPPIPHHGIAVPDVHGFNQVEATYTRKQRLKAGLLGKASLDPLKQSHLILRFSKPIYRVQQDGSHHCDTADPEHHAEHVQYASQCEVIHIPERQMSNRTSSS